MRRREDQAPAYAPGFDPWRWVPWGEAFAGLTPPTDPIPPSIADRVCAMPPGTKCFFCGGWGKGSDGDDDCDACGGTGLRPGAPASASPHATRGEP